ncbi:NADH:ubiquinone oxidoreductase 11.5kD subunit [Lipomyces starkeyi]|uniref:NADH dehydrogenase [ubiquinone] iron-sulfur protein 5 n=1 Tax=Lipomyces starkeyi NRRL Y-11557 TaxID=675824 RepID=A0A1E3QB17_LIPST|nr:hypothetical protein LIPSTDRAFT_1578 [Lipomyces starkeyi NRRL Y-11557]
MSSGFGLTGGKSRCYNLWVDLAQCESEFKSGAIERSACQTKLADFVECLDHKRERARLEEIREEILQKNKGVPPRRPQRGLIALNQIE